MDPAKRHGTWGMRFSANDEFAVLPIGGEKISQLQLIRTGDWSDAGHIVSDAGGWDAFGVSPDRTIVYTRKAADVDLYRFEAEFPLARRVTLPAPMEEGEQVFLVGSQRFALNVRVDRGNSDRRQVLVYDGADKRLVETIVLPEGATYLELSPTLRRAAAIGSGKVHLLDFDNLVSLDLDGSGR